MLALVVNDDAGCLMPNGVLQSIVGTPPGACSLLQVQTGRWIPKVFTP